MSDVIEVLDPIADELDRIVSRRPFDRGAFAEELRRFVRAHRALFAGADAPTRERVADYLRAAFRVLEAATKILHLGFNLPGAGRQDIRRGRLLKDVEALRDLYDLAEQATRRPAARERFYDGREAQAALATVFEDRLADVADRSRGGPSYRATGGVLGTFLDSDAEASPDSVSYERVNALRVLAFVRDTWLA